MDLGKWRGNVPNAKDLMLCRSVGDRIQTSMISHDDLKAVGRWENYCIFSQYQVLTIRKCLLLKMHGWLLMFIFVKAIVWCSEYKTVWLPENIFFSWIRSHLEPLGNNSFCLRCTCKRCEHHPNHIYP